jgi:folate-binding protein YgfZ
VTSLLLRDFHQKLGARFGNCAESQLVLNYGDPAAEYRHLTETAGVLDLSFRGRICLTGADRARFLHGQVTNDVKKLRAGEGCHAALITAKGKMQSDLNVFCLAEELLLDFEPGLTSAVSDRLEKYVIADDVQIVDVTPHYGLLAIEGRAAEEVVRAATSVADLPQQRFNFVALEQTGGALYIANNPRLGSNGFDLFIPNASLPAMAQKLIEAAKVAGGRPCGWEAFETARVEAGIPRFGADMDETNIPLEAGLENGGISFSKGCYIGQEVISRIKTYGQVARALRVLRLGGAAEILPVKGDKIFKDGKEVGYITSAARSPKLNSAIALGYVRKEVNQIGAELVVRTAAGDSAATIDRLPSA